MQVFLGGQRGVSAGKSYLGRLALQAGQLPLDDTIGVERGAPLEGGCPGGQRLDLGGGHP